MQYSILTLAFAAVTATASPVLEKRDSLCPALDSPLCCQLDVDGIIDATCESRG